MTVYTPNIPQATDNPSNSQSQILQNFQTLNTLYGTDGDHYPWTDTSSTEIGMHAKVTMPGLPTTNAPGNALPTTQVGNCSIFAQTVNNQTTPFLKRENLATIWSLMPIKAMATITCKAGASPAGDPTVETQFNVDTIVKTNSATLTVTLSNAMRTTNYGILITFSTGLSASSFNPFVYSISNTSSFIIRAASGTFDTVGLKVTIVVLEP